MTNNVIVIIRQAADAVTSRSDRRLRYTSIRSMRATMTIVMDRPMSVVSTVALGWNKSVQREPNVGRS